jgi:signal transduction histidine kinase
MGFLSRLSIRSKALLTVAVLILFVGTAISTAAYLVIRRMLDDHAVSRLTTLTAQYRETFRTTMATSRARAMEAANKPEILAYVQEPGLLRESAVREALKPSGPQADLGVRTELRDESGRVLIAYPAPGGEGAARFPTLDQVDGAAIVALAPAGASGGNVVGYSKFHQDGEVALYATVVRLPGSPEAYYVAWRRLTSSSQARVQLASLIGNDAAVYVLNADGSLWTELGRPAGTPPGPLQLGQLVRFDRAGRGRVLSVSAALDGTPWAFAFEFPEAVVLAPARTFLRMVAIIAAICIAGGMAIAWLMSRRITKPLHELTIAANAIAAGDTSYRVPIARDDQLGALAAAFNTMATQVEESRQRLEALVEERTNKLRAAEESLVRREKLALVGQLASSVGHEIRNPLGVMSNALFYLETILPDATPEVREYLQILSSQVQVSAKIVNDLLDLSRSTPPRREQVGVQTFVGPRVTRFGLNGAVIEADIPPDLPLVDVDPVHAGQVMDNLLNNAVQAIDGHGTVRIRARQADGFVTLEVSDTGPGVPPEHAARIFEPLFTTKARGIGLGLALSKTLAQANGGDLNLISREGESAVFAFTVPVAGARA